MLFYLPLPDDDTVPPNPRVGVDKWDDDHVKLPTSPFNTYIEIDENGERNQRPRWELIKEALTASAITDSHKLEEAVKKYTITRNNEVSLNALHQLFDDEFSDEDSTMFFNSVLPKMIELAIRMPDLIKAPIPLLKKEMNRSISLSQEQAACLLANAFLCTFPARSMARKYTDYPEINFFSLLSCSGDHVVQKLKCILHYFKIVCQDMPTGVLSFQRRYIAKNNFPFEDFKKSTAKLSSVKVTMSEHQRIEDGTGMLQVDFANRYLGGGVLGWGCVQEEIRFVINPEMIVGMLFCESMNGTEAILMTGCERFSKYEGYSRSFKWTGKFNDETPRDHLRRRKTYVVAIDAFSFHNKPHQQFMEFAIEREVRKASVGFFHDPLHTSDPIRVCSGNWGCGAFRGNTHLKALIQIIACCLTGRNLFYCTFEDEVLVEKITQMTKFLEKYEITVGTLWKYLKAFQESDAGIREDQLYMYIYKQHMKSLAVDEATVSVSETKETETKIDTGYVKSPPAKKQRTSEKDEEVESEVLASSVADLNEKLTSVDVTADVKEDEVTEKPETEQTETVVDDKKNYKITNYFKPN